MNRRRAFLAGAALLLQSAALSGASAADPAQIEAGIRIFRGAGQCETCHVWNGAGGPITDLPPVFDVPSLVRSTLDRAAMIELLACGSRGGWMPQYLASAWTERRRCYGKIADQLATDERPPKPYSLLTQEQIEAVVAFVQEVYQGKKMTPEYCIQYFNAKSPVCELLR